MIPPKGFADGNDLPDDARPSSAKDIARAIGVDDDFLKANGWRLRFSGLRISNLSVSTLDASSNAIPCFVAVLGVAKSDGLHLRGCGIIFRSETNCIGRAALDCTALQFSTGGEDYTTPEAAQQWLSEKTAEAAEAATAAAGEEAAEVEQVSAEQENGK